MNLQRAAKIFPARGACYGIRKKILITDKPNSIRRSSYNETLHELYSIWEPVVAELLSFKQKPAANGG